MSVLNKIDDGKTGKMSSSNHTNQIVNYNKYKFKLSFRSLNVHDHPIIINDSEEVLVYFDEISTLKIVYMCSKYTIPLSILTYLIKINPCNFDKY